MKTLTACIALTAVAAWSLANAQTFDPKLLYSPPAGFFTGSHFEGLPPQGRLRYLTGLMDGFLYAPMFAARGNADFRRTEQLSQCNDAIGLSDIQLLKIVDDYMAKHPQEWGAPMNGLVYSALGQLCKNAGHSIY